MGYNFSEGTLISFLRQLRDAYVNRSRIPFVHSVALVGMRNIRDDRGKIRDDRDTLGSNTFSKVVWRARAWKIINARKERIAVPGNQRGYINCLLKFEG